MAVDNTTIIKKEVQKKRKNPIYFGFSLAYFFCLMVIATGAYSISGEFLFRMAVVAASYDLLVPLVENFGIAPFFILYAILPIGFLIIRLGSSISIEVTDNHIVFKNIYLLPVQTYKIDIKEIDKVGLMKIKPGEHKVDFFTKRAFTYKKIMYIYGNYSLKLSSNIIKQDTIIMGTQKPQQWLYTLKEREINVSEDSAGEVVPIPKIQPSKVQSTQS